LVFTLKGWELSDQGNALVFWATPWSSGHRPGLLGIALVFWNIALAFWNIALISSPSVYISEIR
jgi:hypothetical protein